MAPSERSRKDKEGLQGLIWQRIWSEVPPDRWSGTRGWGKAQQGLDEAHQGHSIPPILGLADAIVSVQVK